MNVVAVRKSTPPRDATRDALRTAIAQARKAQAAVEERKAAIMRAKDMLTTAERQLSEAAVSLEAARERHAEQLVEAATATAPPKATPTTLRAARQSLLDAEDRAQSARLAVEHLEVDAKDMGKATTHFDDAIVTAVAEATIPIAEQFLERVQRAQDELLISQTVFQALTEGDGEQVLLPSGEFARRADLRMKPLASVRQRFFQLDSRASQERAKECAVAWRQWLSRLRIDADAELPSSAPFRP
jgi:hypothetical protein